MKHKTTKLLSILLALVMIAGLLPGQVAYAAGIEFTTQPQSGTAPKTGSYTFTWEVSGTPVDVVLQEYRISDSEWSNRTSVKNVTSYTVTYNENVSKYRLLAQDSINTRYYSNEVTVTWTGEEAFRFTTQPQNGTAPKTGSHTFTWALDETPDDAVWQEYWISTSEWVNMYSVTDATSQTVTYNDNVSKYRIMARKGSKTIYSNEVSVTWTGEEAFRFTTQPQSGTAPKTGSYTFTWALDETPTSIVLQVYNIYTGVWGNTNSLEGMTSWTVTYNENIGKYRIAASKGSKDIYSNEFTVTWTDDSVTTYTVTFKDGESTLSTATVNSGEKVTKPADPTKTGYTFNGWYADATFTAAFDFDQPITANTTIYAKFTDNSVTPPGPTTYTVTFKDGESVLSTVTVNSGEKVTKPADPTKTGYTFNGWYADATFTAAFDFDQAITANTTVYAKFTDNSVTPPATITYTVTGGANSTWTKGSNATVTITVKRIEDDANCFTTYFDHVVEIDGTALAASDYEAKSGSTVITIKAAALQKLSTGNHTVTVKFKDGEASTGLTVKAASGSTDNTSPETGDESNLRLWVLLMLMSILGFITTVAVGLKKRQHSR